MEEKKVMVLFVLVIAFGLLVTTISASHIDDMTCNEALSLLTPCKPYLEGSVPEPPPADSCSGARTVFQRANSTQVCRDLCECLKWASGLIHMDPGRAQKLPPYCKITAPFPVGPTVNCSAIP